MAKLRKEMVDFFRIKKESDFRLVLNNYGLTYDFNKTQVSINCPFHDDSSPSCKINFEKNIFNCFGCHTSGNIIDFVCYMENLNPQDGKDFRKGGILVQSMALIGVTREFGNYCTLVNFLPLRILTFIPVIGS